MKRTRRVKIILICSLAACMLLLTGCWDRKEVNDLALVTGAAIDQTNNNTVEVSVQVYIPRAPGGAQKGMGDGGGGGGGGAQTLVRSATGTSVADAMSKLQERLPRKIFWGHTDVFLIGEKMAKQGIRHLIEFILRFPQPRERAAILVIQGNGKLALAVHPPLERFSSETLREMSKSRLGMDVDIKRLSQMLSGDAGAAALPWVEMLPPDKDQDQKQSIPYIRGTAVFKKDKMVGRIDDELTRGVLWVRNEIGKEAVITFNPKEEEGSVSLWLEHSRTQLKPQIRNGKWSMDVVIETEVSVIQNATSLNIMNPETNASLENQLGTEISGRVEKVIAKAKAMNTDIFDFAEAFHRKYPKEWKQVKGNWDDKFTELEIKVDTKAKILRPGSITNGGNRPKQEEKQS